MKRIDWNKAKILADIYKLEKDPIYISAGHTFKESTTQDIYKFVFDKDLDIFINAKGVTEDITARAFSLNVYEFDSYEHIDFDIGMDI